MHIATPQVLLLLDADFIVSKDLHAELTQSERASALMEDLTSNRRLIVLPAFETEASLGIEQGGDMALQAQASARPLWHFPLQPCSHTVPRGCLLACCPVCMHPSFRASAPTAGVRGRLDGPSKAV